MPSLADLQAGVCRAMTSGDPAGLGSVLIGGRHAQKRLRIHQRHYEASLVAALFEKFPATTWLVGSDFMRQVSSAFVRAHPPSRPCIAEYGADLPTFLATHGCGATLPYLGQFAELEWHVGQVSIAVSEPAVAWSEVVGVGAESLLDVKLRLQSGLRYVQGTWAVDDLMAVYMSGSAPDLFTLAEGDTRIEIKGAHGEVRFARLDAATFIFRTALVDGLSLGDAAERALEQDERFDPAQALVALVAVCLVTAITPEQGGEA
jgi:Putative DNA-binding domain